MNFSRRCGIVLSPHVLRRRDGNCFRGCFNDVGRERLILPTRRVPSGAFLR